MNDMHFRDQIVESVGSLVNTDHFKRWLSAERSALDDDLIIVNNSFMDRQGIPSTKNTQYLCLEHGDRDRLSHSTVRVCQPGNFNSDFKRYAGRSRNLPPALPLPKAVEDNLAAVGQLVFLLIGALDETIGAAVAIKSSLFSELRFAPVNKDLVVIDDDAIEINFLGDPEAIWMAFEQCFRDHGPVDGQVPDGFDQKFIDALQGLRDEVHSVVRLPDGPTTTVANTLIRRISTSLQGEIENYDRALENCGGDPSRDAQSFSDVLRIAYNFASDSSKLTSLIVSICDLKPLLLWATVAEHLRLAQSFRELPWAKGAAKASIRSYQEMVNGARNHAFHDLIRMDRSIHVEVDSVTLQARSLRLFAPYAKKRGNALEYEDQELVGILTQFTHAPETVVPAEFWRKNSRVMHALEDVFVSTERALVLLHNERVRVGQ